MNNVGLPAMVQELKTVLLASISNMATFVCPNVQRIHMKKMACANLATQSVQVALVPDTLLGMEDATLVIWPSWMGMSSLA